MTSYEREREDELEMALCQLLRVDRGNPGELARAREFLLQLAMWIDMRARNVAENG
jgi:hypothetical protein